MSNPVNESFEPARPWVNGTLQTLADRIRPRYHDLGAAGAEQRVKVGLSGSPGEGLVVKVHRPHRDRNPALPIVLVVHGLGGSSESTYVRAMTLGLLRAGYSAARVDLRGVGESIEHTHSLNHAGRSGDLREICRELSHLEVVAGVAVVGFSLGGNMTLKLLGEGLEGLPIRGGASVCAPLDLAATATWLRRRAMGLYERSFVHRLRVDTLASGIMLTPAERQLVHELSTISAFDDLISAGRNGWRDASQYYAVNSSVKFLGSITVPALVVHAMDDPMIPRHVYLDVDWAELESRTPVRHAITQHGGHVGFHSVGGELPWYTGRIVRFLDALPQQDDAHLNVTEAG